MSDVQAPAYEPVPWDMIPDLGLYMDQVTTYLQRQCRGLYPEGERVLTPAMINNYVKCSLVSRPTGKKYGREQLSQLIMLCVLKPVATVEEMKRLMAPGENDTAEALYGRFLDMTREASEALSLAPQPESPMACAVRAAAYRVRFTRLLNERD